MRIGKLEDMERTKKDAPPAADTEDENTKEQTSDSFLSSFWYSEKGKKWRNWWDYHKWYVICGVIVLGIACNLLGSALGLWKKTPDLQIAYVGSVELPDDTTAALEQAFASIAEDFNQDGKILVQVNQYITGSPDFGGELSYYGYASEVTLIGDISNCDSYFFLLENPQQFQSRYQLLAAPDGSCPADSDDSVEDKVILWADCPLLSQMELGTYSTAMFGEERSGSNQEQLSQLFIGRRCFYADEVTENVAECSELWNLLLSGR